MVQERRICLAGFVVRIILARAAALAQPGGDGRARGLQLGVRIERGLAFPQFESALDVQRKSEDSKNKTLLPRARHLADAFLHLHRNYKL